MEETRKRAKELGSDVPEEPLVFPDEDGPVDIESVDVDKPENSDSEVSAESVEDSGSVVDTSTGAFKTTATVSGPTEVYVDQATVTDEAVLKSGGSVVKAVSDTKGAQIVSSDEPLARVNVSLGRTYSLPDYESVRVSVSVTIPTEVAKVEETIKDILRVANEERLRWLRDVALGKVTPDHLSVEGVTEMGVVAGAGSDEVVVDEDEIDEPTPEPVVLTHVQDSDDDDDTDDEDVDGISLREIEI
jgi:hypothetical protein